MDTSSKERVMTIEPMHPVQYIGVARSNPPRGLTDFGQPDCIGFSSSVLIGNLFSNSCDKVSGTTIPTLLSFNNSKELILLQ